MLSSRLNVISRHLNRNYVKSISSKSCLKQRKKVKILEGTISYVDTETNGENVLVFLHGNPTSSYLWRNIIPHLDDCCRCVAPDLIGMGGSSKVENISYTFEDHFKYLCEWIENMKFPEKINLVVHDWGSSLGFRWAFENQHRVSSVTHMESLVCSVPDWDHFPEVAKNIFQAMRSDAGEEIVLKKNFFVKKLLPMSIMRKLSEEEMNEYIEPFKDEGNSRLPTLTWPRQIPVKGDGPENVIRLTDEYSNWLSSSHCLPKLYIDASPGFFSPFIREYTKNWPNQKTVTVKGLHFLQEDSPNEIAFAIKDFLNEKVLCN